MGKIEIIRIDPLDYKDSIIKLWEKNLPDTPKSRFNWMERNPEGPSVWYVARDEKRGVIGTISIMPRVVLINCRKYLAGIVGDLTIDKAFRTLGPALNLLKTVLFKQSEMGFDFLYTYPNTDALKITIFAGFKKLSVIKRLVKPLNVRNKLEENFSSQLVNITYPIINGFLKILSKETYMKKNEMLMEEDQSTLSEFSINQFGILLEEQLDTIGRRNYKYIKWKYFDNPQYSFRIFIYTHSPGKSIQGYIICTILDNTVHIFDILAKSKQLYKLMLGQFIKRMRELKYSSISININHDNPMFYFFKYFGFIDRRDNTPLLYKSDKEIIPINWLFFNGDRNI